MSNSEEYVRRDDEKITGISAYAKFGLKYLAHREHVSMVRFLDTVVSEALRNIKEESPAESVRLGMFLEQVRRPKKSAELKQFSALALEELFDTIRYGEDEQ